MSKTLQALLEDVTLLKAASPRSQATLAPVATSGLSDTDPTVQPNQPVKSKTKRAAKKPKRESSSYPPHPVVQHDSEEPVLDHPRIRILAAIKRHTGTALAKSLGHAGYDAAEDHFQQLVGELANRPVHHAHHEEAAGALIAASRNLLAAHNHLEARAGGASPSRLEKIHARIGVASPVDRHVAAAQGLLHAAHTLIARGDLTLNHLYGEKSPLPEFAKTPVPPMPNGASPVAAMLARHRGDLKPVKGTARLLANVVTAKNAEDITGPQKRLVPPPASRPAETPGAPVSLMRSAVAPIAPIPSPLGGPKRLAPAQPVARMSRDEPRRLL